MDCAQAKLQIEPYVAGELPADAKAPLEEHLETCAECRLDSELTRASRNAPTDPPPALEAGGDDGASAAGAGEGSAHAGASGGDWTLDTIFGAGGAGRADGAGGAAGAGPSASAAPASPGGNGDPPETQPAATPPEDDAGPPESREPDGRVELEPIEDSVGTDDTPLPAVLEAPVEAFASSSDAAETPSWDFEPTDAKSDAKPPEGSLFFAEEALSRADSGKGTSSVLRLILWCAGGVVGLALLGVSVWIALSLRQPSPPSSIAPKPMIVAGSGPSPPEPTVPPAPAPAVSEAPAAVPAPTPAPVETHAAPETPEPPASLSPPAPKVEPKAAAIEPPPARPHARPSTSSPHTPPASPAPRVAATHAPTGPVRTTVRSDAVVIETPKPEVAPAKGTATEPAPAPAPVAPKAAAPVPSDGGTTAPPAGSTVATPEPTTPAPGPAPTAPEPSQAATVERPIDRLHLATSNAEQNADLPALRKMRDTWRGFVKTSVGPDRARAKRELADCLWAIQTLTLKSSDQKEALAAYRDYVLNAPAGGADARTVARMRQLEDAVAESR